MWQPGSVSSYDDQRRRSGGTLTVERPREAADDPYRDVSTAYGRVRVAEQLYGDPPRRPRRATNADRMRDFVRRYGWRAYALPILAVVTIVAVATMHGGRSPSRDTPAAQSHETVAPTVAPHTPPPPAGSHIALKSDAPGPNAHHNLLASAALPTGAPYSKHGTGTYRVLPGHSAVMGSGPLHRFDIEVEHGVTGVDLSQFQHMVVSVLGDHRSWSGHGVSLQRVDSGEIDFHVSLVSSMTIRKLCGYTIHVETSCFVAAGTVPGVEVNRVAFNVARWVRGATAYLGDLHAYREYMINHEVGHALGHEHAHECLPGGLAPAMMQQTFGLRSAATGKMCRANPWPYPPGVKGAPGAEQPDTPQNDEYGLSKGEGD